MKIYTTSTAAKLLGLQRKTLTTYATRYRIGQKHGGTWIFDETDIAIVRTRAGKIGRPKDHK